MRLSQLSSYLSNDWRNIIWREWRYTPDREYAQFLFGVVIDEPAGWMIVAISFLLGTYLGALTGFIVSFIIFDLNPWWQHPTLIWTTLVPLVWVTGIICGMLGIIEGLQLRKSSFFYWLAWFTPGVMSPKLDKRLNPFITLLVLGLVGISLGTLEETSILIMLLLGFFLFSRGGWLFNYMNSITLASGLALTGLFWYDRFNHVVGIIGLVIGIAVGAIIGAIQTSAHKTIILANIDMCRNRYFWWGKRPTIVEMAAALRQASVSTTQRIPAKPLRQLSQKTRRPASPEIHINGLKSNEWITRLAAHHALVALGGEAAQPLKTVIIGEKDASLAETAMWLLQNIEQDTTSRLAEQAEILLCPQCLVRCHSHCLHLLSSSPSFTYYGCRACHQSREFIEFSGEVVVVLDQEWRENQSQKNGLLRVNWLTRRNLFDFDRVEIIQASDEEVERFAVQVGNDTDAVRKPCYKEMSCLVAPDCHLSENTWRILRSTFGEVKSSRSRL